MYIRYLYHLTKENNLNSIMEYGLGAHAGDGINLVQATFLKVYMVCFDPMPYLNGKIPNRDEERERKYIIDLICRLLLNRDDFINLVVIKINLNQLPTERLIKDPHPNEKFVYISIME